VLFNKLLPKNGKTVKTFSNIDCYWCNYSLLAFWAFFKKRVAM
jgi:hypothetical protein